MEHSDFLKAGWPPHNSKLNMKFLIIIINIKICKPPKNLKRGTTPQRNKRIKALQDS